MIHHHVPECLLKILDYCVQGQSHRCDLTCHWMFVRMISSQPPEHFVTKLDVVIKYHKPECPVEKNWLLHSRSRSQQLFKMSVNVCSDNIFWTMEHFVTKLGVVMQHHEPECHSEKIVCCLQGCGLSKGSYNQIWLFLLYLLNCWFFSNQTWSDDISS